MAASYITRDELKAASNIAVADLADDSSIDIAIEAASRAIDEHCHRFFYKAPELGTQDRFYESDQDLLIVDDIISPPEQVIIAFASSPGSYVEPSVDLRLYPANAQLEGKPFTHLKPDKARFPAGLKRGVLARITAQFGWPAVPPAIRQATMIQASRFFQRRTAPFGISGSPEMGQMRLLSKLDPDVEMLVMPFVKGWHVQ